MSQPVGHILQLGGASRFPHSVPDNKSAVRGSALIPQLESRLWYIPRVPAKPDDRQSDTNKRLPCTYLPRVSSSCRPSACEELRFFTFSQLFPSSL